MKKLIAFVIFCSSLVILWCPYSEAQWEDAEVQRLTYNSSTNNIKALYIDKDDKLLLFYTEWKWDPYQQPYKDTILLITKEAGGDWTQPEKIGNSAFDAVLYGKWLAYDVRTGITHMIYIRQMSLDYDTMYYTNSQVPNWELVKIDSLSNDHNADYSCVNIGFDAIGNVHLAWNEDFDSASYSWYRVMYVNNSAGQWAKQQITPPIFLGGMNSGPSYLAVERNGTAHVLYYEDNHHFYARNGGLNGTSWEGDTIPRPSRPLYHYAGGDLTIDGNDTLHMFASGCIVEECYLNAQLQRVFYYRKHGQDDTWQGPDLVLDSLMYTTSFFIDTQSVPYLAEWDPYTFCSFFTDRKPGFWQEPYQILDTSSMCNSLSSTYVTGFSFVLDSEGSGHAVFGGCLREFMGQDDSLEIFYYGALGLSVESETEDQKRLSFQLFQNYPNPFNQNTLIRYSLDAARPVPVSLKIYNILGEEVRELVNTTQSRGDYRAYWDGEDNSRKEVSSGIYFYLLRAGNAKQAKKMLLMK